MGDKLRTITVISATLLLAVGMPLFANVQMAAAESQPLSAPLLLSPADKDIVKGTKFTQSWTAVAGAEHYEYESYNDSHKTQLRARQEVNGTSKTVAKVPDSTFWWRVRAVGAQDKPGQWSALRRITTDNVAPTIRPLQTIGDKPVQGTVRFVFESVDKHPWRVTSGVFSEVPPGGIPIGSPDDDEGVAEAIDVNVTTKATLNINTLTMPNGRETIIINVEDRAGNIREERFYFTVANPTPSPEAPQTGATTPTAPRLVQTTEKVVKKPSQGRTVQMSAAESAENLPTTEAGKVLGVHTQQHNEEAAAAKSIKPKDANQTSYWYVMTGFVLLSIVGSVVFIRKQMTS